MATFVLGLITVVFTRLVGKELFILPVSESPGLVAASKDCPESTELPVASHSSAGRGSWVKAS